jgi:alpha,alpha-trehalose phosphorylase
VLPPEDIYPIDDWAIVERKFSQEFVAQNETIFALANGYIGMRGNFSEGTPVFESGTYVNGFHEIWPIVYGEEAFGFATTGQTMLSVPDGKTIRLFVDDEPFFLPTASFLAYERRLDMKDGVLDREVLWETPSGKRVSIKSRRMVSFEHRHLAAIDYEVTVLNANAPVVLISELKTPNDEPEHDSDPRKAKGFDDSPLVPVVHASSGRRTLLGFRARKSGMTLGCGIDHVVDTSCSYVERNESTEDSAEFVLSISATRGTPVRLTKYLSYHSSRSAPPDDLCDRCTRSLDRALEVGFTALSESQRAYMDDFWHRSDVELESVARRGQQYMRFNLFHILQATGRAEGAGVSARGLTGQTYEGHYFWDAETYVLPFLIYTSPRIARNLLKFRYGHLDKARERAREVNNKGALFPWRTINGEEASAFFPAGTAQYHINADIMYALRKYVDATGDEEFLHKYGAEMLVETARLWADLGGYPPGNDSEFHIHGVTGPDEYTAIVNDNTFTNLMARHNLRYAVETVEMLRAEYPEKFAALQRKTNLQDPEIEEWQRAADHMYVPYDEARGVHPQDDHFLEKELWDFERTPPENYPLLLHYHPLTLYRHQVIKQADVVLAMFLLGSEFTLEQKRRNFEYYDPITTGDSSLSAAIQSIIAAEIGDLRKAFSYALDAALMDLADVGGNVKDGAHIASMGGTWMAAVYGFAGMRDYNGCLSFDPVPLSQVQADRLSFRLEVRGQSLRVSVEDDKVTYMLENGRDLTITHCGKEVVLSAEHAVTVGCGDD